MCPLSTSGRRQSDKTFRRRASRTACAALGAVALAVLGCGGSEQKATISGSIQWDGDSIETGEIIFAPVEGTPASARVRGHIKAGSYEIAGVNGLRPGKYRIEIYGYRNRDGSSRPIDFSDAEADYEQFVPVQHNKGSRALIEINPGDDVRVEDFELTE